MRKKKKYKQSLLLFRFEFAWITYVPQERVGRVALPSSSPLLLQYFYHLHDVITALKVSFDISYKFYFPGITAKASTQIFELLTRRVRLGYQIVRLICESVISSVVRYIVARYIA